MKEVWQEIMAGVCVKTLVITLLSLTISCLLFVLIFYSSTGWLPERDELKKTTHMKIPHEQIKSTQTNFTQ